MAVPASEEEMVKRATGGGRGCDVCRESKSTLPAVTVLWKGLVCGLSESDGVWELGEAVVQRCGMPYASTRDRREQSKRWRARTVRSCEKRRFQGSQGWKGRDNGGKVSQAWGSAEQVVTGDAK